MKTFEELKASGEAPEWMNEESFRTLSFGYLLTDETPRGMYRRIAQAAGSYTSDPSLWEKKFFEVMWKNWLCPASPILSNLGSSRGLPISCNSIHVEDSIHGIFSKNYELASLSKNGAGVGVYLGDIRARGSDIKGNGKSTGVVPWAKVYDTTTICVNQGSTRRGASAVYLPVDHGDIEEFINIRRPTGDVNRRCLNLNHGICIKDDWMNQMIDGDESKRKIWKDILRTRAETGEPYLLFIDTVNKNNPDCYKDNNLEVKTSNICTEVTLFTDPNHTFVCCLSSMNLVRWDEWKDTDTIEVAIRFLDAVLEEYIQKTKGIEGLQASRASAVKGRAVGLGVLGWHTLLQEKMLKFDSFESMMLNAKIFSTMKKKAEIATKLLAEELGEPEWCKGYGRRNTHLMAVAPTFSNSTISGGHSAGIEPVTANVFVQKSANGTFIRKNKTLENILKEINQDTPDIWKSINENLGSVQHLSFLNDEIKAVFLTARELNQYSIIKQAGQRQKYIDQAQSVNLFFASNSDPKYIHGVHLAAWEEGLKSLYYLRTEGVLRGDLASRSKEECSACEG
jgi:ribonucleoside-diphosphate reductase alpha chain